MSNKKRLNAILLAAILALVCLTAVACDSLTNCTDICPICLGCRRATCFKHVQKCGGHVGDGETCTDLCEVCGACKDLTCLQHDEKCQGHQSQTDCTDLCSVCGKCKNPDCLQHSEKCGGHTSQCTNLCPTCGLCLDAFCKNHTDKCKGHSSSEGSNGKVDFYAINDFHGEVDKFSQFAEYLSNRNDGNTLLINSGDMFQGSMQSNSNSGKLLAACMDEVGFASLTIGNHEFDWGLDKLIELKNNSETPFLGANIYKWNAAKKTWGDFADDVAQKYVVRQLDNGLRVGIIGVIGKKQITSISSRMVQNIGFKDPAEVIPDLARELREKQQCNVVVVSAHADQDDFLYKSSFDVTQYADAVFCAHSHQEETTVKNGVVFIQGGSNGRFVSHVKLQVEDGKVSLETYSNESYSSSWGVNKAVQSLIDNANDKIKIEAEQQLARLDGTLNYNYGVGRLACHAIADYCNQIGTKVDLTMCNQGRAELKGGIVTYSDLYESLPFDNPVYVARVSGADILNEVRYVSFWRNTEQPIERDKYYTVAIIDYILLHQNVERDYDYFPSATRGEGTFGEPLQKEGVENYNYRLIVKDFLLKQGSIAAANYNNESNFTDSSLLSSTVKLDESQLSKPDIPQVENDGTESNPYTVKDAVALAKTGAEYKDVYVTGTFLAGETLSYNATYGNYTFTLYYTKDNYLISLYCYGINLSEETLNKLKSGENVTITISTTLKLYNDAPEAYLGNA